MIGAMPTCANPAKGKCVHGQLNNDIIGTDRSARCLGHELLLHLLICAEDVQGERLVTTVDFAAIIQTF